jgi:hypothetical protein
MHFALQEGIVLVHFIENLPVCLVQALGQHDRLIVIEKRPAGAEIFMHLVTPRVTLRAGFQLRVKILVFEIWQTVADIAIPKRRPALG